MIVLYVSQAARAPADARGRPVVNVIQMLRIPELLENFQVGLLLQIRYLVDVPLAKLIHVKNKSECLYK